MVPGLPNQHRPEERAWSPAATGLQVCCGPWSSAVPPCSSTESPSSCVPHIFLYPAALLRIPWSLLLCILRQAGKGMGPTCRTLSIAHGVLWICLLNISHSDGISWLSVRVEDSLIPVEPVDSSTGRAAGALNHFGDGVHCLSGFPHDPCTAAMLCVLPSPAPHCLGVISSSKLLTAGWSKHHSSGLHKHGQVGST